jgi:hypothetical protein
MATYKSRHPLGLTSENSLIISHSEAVRVDSSDGLIGPGAIVQVNSYNIYLWNNFFERSNMPDWIKAGIRDTNTPNFVNPDDKTSKNFSKPSGMEGQVTYDSEGNDDSQSHYFSRRPHVPSSRSGVTIGRGYDMKTKSKNKIKNDLIASGVNLTTADKLSSAAGMSGESAKKYIKDKKLNKLEITNEQQKKLFSISYGEIKKDVQRLCNKEDVIETYGSSIDIEKIHYAIREITVDLRFRGDYTGFSRKFLQKHIINNDLKEFKNEICNTEKWKSVPTDRFNRRCNYLKGITTP